MQNTPLPCLLMPRRTIVSLVVSLGAALSLAACGGSGQEPPPTPPAAADIQRPVTGGDESSPRPSVTPKLVVGSREIDPCSLLTKAETEAVLGEPVGETYASDVSEQAGVRGKSCRYPSVAAPTLRLVSVVVFPRYVGSVDMWKKTREAWNQSIVRVGTPLPSVPGVGDEAFWVDSRINNLFVRKGDVFLVIYPGVTTSPAALVTARDLARRAVSRLP